MAGDSGLIWGVRAQFTDYVQRTGGTVSFGGATTWEDGRFRFPAVRTTSGAAGVRLEFAGEVLYQGHGGLLRLGFCDPWVDLSGAGIQLSVDADGRRTVLGVAGPDVVPEVRDGARRSIPLTLAGDGVGLFGGVYAEGLELDPIDLALPTGADTPQEPAAIPVDRVTTA